MSVNRRDVLGLAAAGALLPRFAFAQVGRQRLVAAMIGAAGPDDPAGIEWANEVLAGLRTQGWIEGENFRFEVRFTAGVLALTEQYAAELAAMNPDIFVTGTNPNAHATRRVAPHVPLVFGAFFDPVGEGLVDRIARPGGITTGITHYEPSHGGKFVDLLMEVAPATALVVSLTNSGDVQQHRAMRPFIIEACAVHGVGYDEILITGLDEIGPAVDAVAVMPGAGLLLPPNNWVHNNAAHFVAEINRRGIPAVYPAARMVEQGGLVGYGVDVTESFFQAGVYAGRILNGVDPGALPVLSPRTVLTVNLRTAEAQGITIPISILATADRIVE